MEEAGVGPALARGMAALRARVKLPAFPEWFTEMQFWKARIDADPWKAGEYVHKLRAAERQLRLRTANRVAWCEQWQPAEPSEDVPALPPWAADADESQKCMVIALARLALGAAVEAALADEAIDRGAPGSRQSEADLKTPRLYQDAFLVGVWTSAHAQYVSYIQSGVEEPPEPELQSVPNAAAEFDWSDLFSRRFCPRLCPKAAQPLLQIMMRSTWNTLLESALQESMAARIVVSNSLVIALGGMHPFLHPAMRPPWPLRMRVLRVAQHNLVDADLKRCAVSTAAATKEAVRRMLASTMTSVPAMQNAFAHAPLDYVTAVQTAFRVSGSQKESASTHAVVEWDPPWLGKGTASVHAKVPLVTVASELWAVAFRANFLVFWGHCMSKQLRASRLDAAQHRAIHGLNTCTKLTLALDERDQLKAQRHALKHLSAGLLTLEEAAVLLGVSGVKGTSSNGGARGPVDALRAISAAGSKAAARLLVFARAAWVCESLLIVDLGERTRAMQIRALYRRMGRADYDPQTSGVDNLPVHATHLHACVECARVANAYSCSDHAKTNQAFNEQGVSSSMLCTQCCGDNVGSTHIRCAKRSSAALRTAVTFEDTMMEREVEADASDAQAVRALLGEALSSTTVCQDNYNEAVNGIAARVRRDAKNALEQRATAQACGEQPMLCMPAVGRAIRLWGEWYALCSLCGAMLRVLPQNRFGGEICCNRCDAQMLGMPVPEPQQKKAAVCRFCGKADIDRNSSRWKSVKAPLDLSGENMSLPPPLRSVVYCPLHSRAWLVGAHRVLPTRVILSHIAHNAKPVYSSDKIRTADELGFDAPLRGRKRRRRKGAALEDEGSAA